MPQNTQITGHRNQAMDCCKLIAAIAIIFVHIGFPGEFGMTINCLARFSVPVFFAISGYFSYQTKSDKLFKRMLHIVKLYLIATAIYMVWGCFKTAVVDGGSWQEYLQSILTLKNFVKAIELNTNLFSGHLWYLSALAECYLVLYIFVRLHGEDPVRYQPLYIAGAVLLVLHMILDEFSLGANYEVFFTLHRNAWLYGLPMFFMGIFLREHQDRILKNFHFTTAKQLVFILVGALFSLASWNSVGVSELPLGTWIEVIGLMLLLISHPKIADPKKLSGKILSTFDVMSTVIYIVHMLLIDVYLIYLKPDVAAALGENEPWLRPLIVAAMTIAVSILCERLHYLVKRGLAKK